MNWARFEILDNSPVNLMWFAVVILVAFVVRKYLSRLIGVLLFKIFKRFSTNGNLQRFQLMVLPPLQYVTYFLIVRIALEMLHYPDAWKVMLWKLPLQDVIDYAIYTLIWWSVTWLLLRMIDFAAYIMLQRALKTETKFDDQWVPFIKDVMKVALLTISILFLLGFVYGFNITSLLAGVGIGGLAIALAAQESIKNLFGSLTIFMDKPFMMGDVVKIGDVQGTVEEIGFRSTRIRTTEKTFVTMPNKVMVDSSVDNLSARTFRRVNMNLGLKYETKPEALRNIIDELDRLFKEQAGDNEEDTDNYVAFDSFGESSLNLVIQYFIPQKPFKDFLKEKQEVNFRIMEIVTKHGAEFAYPVRVMRMEKEE